MAEQLSKRAEILRRLLPYINSGDYTEYEDFIVFGASSVEELIEDLTRSPNVREDQSLSDEVLKLLSDFRVHHGRAQGAKRLSLGKTPSFKSDARDRLSQTNQPLVRALEGALATANPPVEDTMDAAFTEELLGKLPKIVSRALRFDHMGIEHVAEGDLRRYFHEAHRCYLYGFTVASAVLCRAILECALKSRCDEDGAVEKSVPKGRSYFGALVNEAVRRSLLKDDRPKCAIQVKKAGDDAIHNFQEFERHWERKLGEVVDNTRKILIDLYGETTGI